MGMGSPVDPETGAPLNPNLGRKALIASAVAAVLWVIFYLLIVFKVMAL
jgi:predicted secreted protein